MQPVHASNNQNVESPRVNDPATNVHDLELFGLKIHNHTLADAVHWATTPHPQTETAVFVNVNSVNLGYHDNALVNAINDADRVFADGSGVRIGAKRLGVTLRDNVNGTDLAEPLCKRAAELGQGVFLLGGKPGVASRAARALHKAFPKLVISGTQHGYFDRNGEENQQLIDRINASGAAIVLVAFGSPLQEDWVARHRHDLQANSVLAVGGLLDFLSGNIPRAPGWMRARGIEWVWRLLQEPRAKFSRYVVGNPLYLLRLCTTAKAKHSVAARAARRSSGLSFGLQRIAATMGLMLIAPMLLLFAGLVALSSKGPVFYSQVRVGKHGRRFRFYKFRSMYMANDPRYVDPDTLQSDRDGVCKKFTNDPRVTPVGRFMRKYSIDELPQLLNVVLGDMALIGPRPALVCEVDDYQHSMYQRFDVLPGLTGLWQVSGRADTSFEEQIALDLQYVNQHSWWQDLRILLSTIPAVVLARGAY